MGQFVKHKGDKPPWLRAPECLGQKYDPEHTKSDRAADLKAQCVERAKIFSIFNCLLFCQDNFFVSNYLWRWPSEHFYQLKMDLQFITPSIQPYVTMIKMKNFLTETEWE